MQIKPDATVRIPVNRDREFFKYWLEILRPFHHLTKREMDVAITYLYNRYELSKVISDNKILEENATNETARQKIRKDCNISTPHFQIIRGKLRKSKILIGDDINPKFIPNLKKGENTFQLLFLFDFPNEE